MSVLSTVMGASLILIFSLTYLHVESLALCSHHFLEQSLRHASQSLNSQKDIRLLRTICNRQAELAFEKKGLSLNSQIISGELRDSSIEIKAKTIWGKSENQ
jgi:hypothetical protein